MMKIADFKEIKGVLFYTPFLVLGFALFCPAALAMELKVQITDKRTREAVPVRCLVMDPQGVAVRPEEKGLTVMDGVDHFYAEGPFTLNLETGLKYKLHVDRGLAWLPADVVFSVTEAGKTASLQVGPYVNLAYNHWFSGDMDLRVPVGRMPVILGSADLNVACQTVPASEVTLPEKKNDRGVVHHPGERAYSGRDWDFGDFNLLSSLSAMSLDETPFNASHLPSLSKGRGLGGFVEVVNPEGEEVPVMAALGWVDLMRVVGPRKSGEEVWTEEQVMDRFKAYYRYLDCGFQIPISAASLGTEKSLSPLDRAGGARVYARIFGGFSFGAFVKSLKAGKSWATNGPILSLAVNGRDLGEVHRSYAGAKLKISYGARSRRPLSRVELVYNGEVVSSLPISSTTDVTLKDFEIVTNEGGWIAARAFEAQVDSASPVRYAHTSPVYVLSTGVRWINKPQAQKFADQIEQRLNQLRNEIPTPDATGAKVLAWYEQARQKYLKLLE